MTGTEALLSNPFELIYTYLVAIAMSITRPAAMFSVLPIITRLGLPNFIQYTIAMVLSVNTVGVLVDNPAAIQSMSPMIVAFIALKETFIGLALGIVVGAPFWAIEMAGNILDFIREAPDASMQDPQGATEASMTGTLFAIFATLMFLAAGGLTTISGLLYSSYAIWPTNNAFPAFDAEAPLRILALLDWMLRTSLLVAAPLLLLIIISFVVLMVIAKFVPQLNVFDMSMVFRNVTYFTMFQIYTVYIITYFWAQISTTNLSIGYLERLLNGGQ